jgi:hypothetical protein
MRRFFIPVGLAVATIYVMRVLFGPSDARVETSGVHAEIVQTSVPPPSVQSAPATRETASLEAPGPDAQDIKAEQGAPSKAETAKEASEASTRVEPKKPRTRSAEARKKDARAITPKRKASSRTRKANRTAKRRLPPHEAYLWERGYPPPYMERRYLLPPLALRRHYWRDYEYY